jgi:hypothetical protein
MGAMPSVRHAALFVELQGTFEGKELAPGHFDVVHAMNYVSALLDLLVALAEKRKEPLSFTGMTLQPGSVAFRIDVDRPAVASALTREAGQMVEGRTLPPRGLRSRVVRLRESILRLPAGTRSVVRVGRQRTVIAPPRSVNDAPTVEQTELRATVYRIGGDPARLWAITETDGGFNAALSQELAEQLAKHLYKEVDLVATLERAEDGRITDGYIHHFHPLEELEDEAEEWRRWFAVAGADWDDVEDLEAELERVREHGAQ